MITASGNLLKLHCHQTAQQPGERRRGPTPGEQSEPPRHQTATTTRGSTRFVQRPLAKAVARARLSSLRRKRLSTHDVLLLLSAKAEGSGISAGGVGIVEERQRR